MKNIQLLLVFCFLTFSIFACKYNVGQTDKTPDLNEGNDYVYGDKGQPARQTKNTYSDTPEGAEKANKIRDKFYGGSQGSNLAETTPAPKDSTAKKEEAKKEEKKNEEKK